MDITEVRIKLMEDSDDRLQAFCSITFDNCFVVRDLKVIEGTNGPFVAMPSRKLTAHCANCGCKNHLRAAYCNQCGTPFRSDQSVRDDEGRAKLYADIAHPINSQCRELIQNRVIAEYQAELQLAKEPGYTSRYDDDFDVEFEGLEPAPPEPAREQRIAEDIPKNHKSMIQPAEPQPRPPHTHTHASTQSAAKQAGRRRGDFGAGIF